MPVAQPELPFLAMQPRRNARSLDLALIALFGLATTLPFAGSFASDDVVTLAAEKRQASPFPELGPGIVQLREFPTRFQAWYDDRFAGRELLLRAHHEVTLAGFGVSPVSSVLVGERGWLFATADSSVEIHRGLRPLAESELELWRTTLEARRDWLAAQGVEYVVAFAPNKETIYPELYPRRLNQFGPTRLDQVTAWLAARSDLELLDLRPALRAEKRFDGVDTVYLSLDTHWSPRGAWAAYVELAGRLARRFPAVRPLPREAFGHTDAPHVPDLALQVSHVPSGPLATFMWQEPGRARGVELAQPGFETWRSEIDDPDLPRVVLAHDSFGFGLHPWLAESCSLLSCAVVYGLPRERILADRPDVMIDLHTERDLVHEVHPFLPPASALTREAFDALVKLVAAADGCALPAGILARGKTEIVPREEDPCGEVALVTHELTDTIELPPFELPPGARPALRVVITAPRKTCLNVWYRTRHARRFQRANNCPFALEAGRNDVCFVLEVDDALDGLLLRPGLEPGSFVLHGLEIAAQPR